MNEGRKEGRKEGIAYHFLQWLHLFTFPQAMGKGSYFPTSLPTLVTLFCLFVFSLIVVLIGSRGFDLHFPND